MEEFKKLKTVSEIIEYLQQFPSNTKVKISTWDCYNDEPYDREVMAYVSGKKRKTVHF